MGCVPSTVNSNKPVTGAMPCHTGPSGDPQFSCDNSNDGKQSNSPQSQDLLVKQHKDGDNDSLSGNMKLKLSKSKMAILLVFSKEDCQSEALKQAADCGNYSYHLAKSSEEARSLYLKHQHDLIIIDCRHSKPLDHEALCRSMRTMFPKSCTRFLAVTKKCNDKDEPSISPLLKAGFSRRFIECTNTGTCLNELVSIECGELKMQKLLQAYNSLHIALQSITESVEITNKNLVTEFINKSYERQTGYSDKDALGHHMQEKLQVDNCNEEETLVYHLKQDSIWEGQQSLKRKNGDTVLCKCRVIPVEGYQGEVSRHVIIRTPTSHPPLTDGHAVPHLDRLKENESRSHEIRSYRRGSYLSLSSSGEVGMFNIKRRESVTRYHSMTIEAPINKVINMLYDAQANPGNNVVQAIDRVLEILQTTELFVPQYTQVKEEDPLTNDYVGGLCDHISVSAVTRHSSYKQHAGHKLGSNFKLQGSVKSPSPEVEKLLEDDSSWNFDILRLECLVKKDTLIVLGMKIFERFGACDHLGIDDSVLSRWLQLISANYRSANTYHNASHAADVLQATAYFLDRMRPKKIMSPQDEVAALIAAVIHDVDHPARTSSFLVNSKDKLALLYNDIAVLENHHAALGFMLTSGDDEANILKNLEREEYEAIRHNVIDMVLATEMAKHFEHLQKFIHICKAHPKSVDDELSIKSGMTSVSDLVINSPENRRQILRMVIKCADVSNPARESRLCREWAYRIAEEYFQQTDEERARKLPVVMPNFDRATCSIPHSQLKFIEVFLLDMFEHWDAFLDIPEVANQLQANYKDWVELDEQQRADTNKLSEVH